MLGKSFPSSLGITVLDAAAQWRGIALQTRQVTKWRDGAMWVTRDSMLLLGCGQQCPWGSELATPGSAQPQDTQEQAGHHRLCQLRAHSAGHLGRRRPSAIRSEVDGHQTTCCRQRSCTWSTEHRETASQLNGLLLTGWLWREEERGTPHSQETCRSDCTVRNNWVLKPEATCPVCLHFAPPPPFAEDRSHWREQLPSTQRERAQRTRSDRACKLSGRSRASPVSSTGFFSQIQVWAYNVRTHVFVKNGPQIIFQLPAAFISWVIRYTKRVNVRFLWEVSTKCNAASSHLCKTSENLKWSQATWPQISRKKREDFAQSAHTF